MNFKEAAQIAAGIDGFMSIYELEWLATAASNKKSILEVGSWKGRSTKALALACPGVVYAVDHWMGSESERRTIHKEALEVGADKFFEIFKANLRDEIQTGKVVPIRAESGDAAASLIKERGLRWLDMVFIDGDHMYESVKRDIQLWMPLVRSGGIISGHDYTDSPGVQRAVKELVHGFIPRSIWYRAMP